MDISDIVAKVQTYQPRYVTVTGGEPLAQKSCFSLLKALCDLGVEVSLETSGAINIVDVDPRVVCVMDLKTPGSGEESKNRYENISLLKQTDQLKFVICDRNDYDWACNKIDEFDLGEQCEVLLSPVHGELQPADIADWIIEDKLAVRLQVQLHKYLWNDEPGR
jgi:7-carboxy-7-deazaguanine synthase|tara:strand:+ start:6492 stop:6983 length:492 start_codon:yes stop_codon:yes gene_type:complete